MRFKAQVLPPGVIEGAIIMVIGELQTANLGRRAFVNEALLMRRETDIGALLNTLENLLMSAIVHPAEYMDLNAERDDGRP